MSTVALASGHARRLVEREARSSGRSLKEAIGPVARRLRAPPGAVWGLLFRAPKRVSADLLAALEVEVVRAIRREIGALEHELVALDQGTLVARAGEVAEVATDLATLRARLAERGLVS